MCWQCRACEVNTYNPYHAANCWRCGGPRTLPDGNTYGGLILRGEDRAMYEQFAAFRLAFVDLYTAVLDEFSRQFRLDIVARWLNHIITGRRA